MSIWTFDLRHRRVRATLALVAALCLTGCMEGASPGASETKPRAERNIPDTAKVFGGAVTLAAPEGYCADRRSSRARSATPFVVFASCATVLGTSNVEAPRIAGLLTATVSDAGGEQGGLTGLSAFFRSEAGRAALAQDGQASSLRIVETIDDGRALLLYVRDTSAVSEAGLDNLYWRSFFGVNGRLITASMVGFTVKPLTRDNGLATLRRFVRRTLDASRPVAAPATNNVAPTPRKRLFPSLSN